MRPSWRRLMDMADIFHYNWLHLKPLIRNHNAFDLGAFDDIRPRGFVDNLNAKRGRLFQL